MSLRELKIYVHTKTCLYMFIAALSIKTMNNQDVLQWVDKQSVVLCTI
jgi:hypothetical protein